MDIKLDYEQFEGAKELAQIGLKIAEGRATLSDLKAQEPAFIAERGRKVEERIKEVLVESRELIALIGTNHDALVEYRKEVTQYVADLRYFIESVKAWKEAADEEIKLENEKLDTKRTEIQALIAEENAQALQLKNDSGIIEKDREALRRESKKLESDRDLIKSGFAALKKAKK